MPEFEWNSDMVGRSCVERWLYAPVRLVQRLEIVPIRKSVEGELIARLEFDAAKTRVGEASWQELTFRPRIASDTLERGNAGTRA